MGYFTKQGDRIYLTGAASMLAYIPIEYFDTGISVEYGGDHISTIGLFNVEFFSDMDSTKRIGKVETVNLPAKINIYPTSQDVKEVELIPGTGAVKYRVFTFLKGEPFTDTFIVKSSNSASDFVNLMEAGKLPRTIPYDQIYSIWTMNMVMNGVAMPEVASSVREMMIAEKHRSIKNTAIRFGMIAGKDGKVSMYDYKPASARDLTKYSSTFAGLTFEDFDTMVINGLNNSKTGRKQVQSPIEPVIKY
ncbi:MAG: hypothetical protein J5965_24200 [Aeriscardovia sp.]|nr:hypothetical protein [Aeriscardovia sp.]